MSTLKATIVEKKAFSVYGDDGKKRKRIRFLDIPEGDTKYLIACIPFKESSSLKDQYIKLSLVDQEGTQFCVLMDMESFIKRFSPDKKDVEKAIREDQVEKYLLFLIQNLPIVQFAAAFPKKLTGIITKPAHSIDSRSYWTYIDPYNQVPYALRTKIDRLELSYHKDAGKVCKDIAKTIFRASSSSDQKERDYFSKRVWPNEGFFIDVQGDPTYSISWATTQGRRDAQEDMTFVGTVLVPEKGMNVVTAVFDGHLGKSCSTYLSLHIKDFLEQYLTQYMRNGFSDVGVYLALQHAIIDLSRSYRGDAGATLLLTLLIDNYLWVANVGDSRAILLDEQAAYIQITEDQKPEIPYYAKDVYARGGQVYLDERTRRYWVTRKGSFCCLAMARSIGDHWALGAISARAQIGCYVLDRKKTYYTIQCSDGIFDVLSTQDVALLVYRYVKDGSSLDEVTSLLVDESLKMGSQDNVTTILREIIL